VPEGDAKLSEVLVRQMTKDGDVNIVFSKTVGESPDDLCDLPSTGCESFLAN
jgi:hypothetical protein